MTQNRILVYTREWCWYGWRVKRFLRRKGYQFEVIDVTNDSEGRIWLTETTGTEALPQVFINYHPVGGYGDIKALDRSGELDRLVLGN